MVTGAGMEEDMEERPLTERAGSACARARRAAVRLRRRLARRRIVVVVVVAGTSNKGCGLSRHFSTPIRYWVIR
jgi:hypothetical protein